ncbi:hypothetical protein LJK88_38880 [Paenibacillus sp. P26]|nr:hypothetical protein LJK88_38880 [Paenibacillus sp. P26]UUZ97783.1 hypothetical protein LJK87_49430 [Paenibacillus sp. P25]
METLTRELVFVRQNKEAIIEAWADKLLAAYPDHYSRGALLRPAGLYFDMMTDLNIPVEEHPFLPFLSEWCRKLADKETPVEHLVRSVSYWRQTMYEVLDEQEPDLPGMISIWKEVHRRIDFILERVCREFTEQTSKRLVDKETAMNQLHDDRLNLIGKMAASMAHEIRNPLTAIKGFLKLIGENLQPESLGKARTYLQLIENEFDNIHMQITGFLSFSKKGVIEEPVVKVTAKQLLDSVIPLLNPRFLSENVSLTVDIGEEAELSIQKVAVQQVIANIINNGLDALVSVKYEKEMSIRGIKRAELTSSILPITVPPLRRKSGRRCLNRSLPEKRGNRPRPCDLQDHHE